MCGILGTIDYSFSQSLLDTLKHRGPDFGDIYSLTCSSHDICFGHRRLSIVDLSASSKLTNDIRRRDLIL